MADALVWGHLVEWADYAIIAAYFVVVLGVGIGVSVLDSFSQRDCLLSLSIHFHLLTVLQSSTQVSLGMMIKENFTWDLIIFWVKMWCESVSIFLTLIKYCFHNSSSTLQ